MDDSEDGVTSQDDPQASQGFAHDVEDQPRPLQPNRSIQKLDEAVVNRIAAGEIIQRPASALKELIENSLDAGASMIRITLRDGGLELLQIQDDGCGVKVSDLPLLCERFATSKLREFSDLTSMTTFGFRGEALASISFVSASMNVVTKTASDPLAYKAFYSAGEMVPPKPGQSAEPKPCAGTDGTTIIAQDLFYSVPQRRRALKSASEEYNRCLDIVGKYALHYGSRGVGFVCKKSGSNAADLSTPSSPATKAVDVIRLLHGNTLARELVHLKPTRNVTLGFKVEGWLSGANWSAKRTTFFCFINNRLVDCSPLKRSFEALYSALLPRGGHPWVYIALEIDPARIDVNVHPTKREVHFLNEEDLIETVCSIAEEALSDANTSRSFQFTQTILPGASLPGAASQSKVSQRATAEEAAGGGVMQAIRAAAPSSQAPQHLVRVDAKTRTLDSMLLRVDGSAVPGSDGELTADLVSTSAAAGLAAGQDGSSNGSRRFKVPQSECTLTSISRLRAEVSRQRHGGLTDIIQNYTFVGIVDIHRGLTLIQHETKLYLIDHDAFVEEAAYGLCLRQFGSLAKTTLQPAVSLRKLVELGIELEASATDVDVEKASGLSRDVMADKVTAHLVSKAEMLSEYFSLDLSSNGDAKDAMVVAIPQLIPGHQALPLENLPCLLLRLATQVDWTEEEACFDTIAREIAYCHRLSLSLSPSPSANASKDTQPTSSPSQRSAEHHVQHVWLPLMASLRSSGFVPSKKLVKEERLIQVASLAELYRIFERC